VTAGSFFIFDPTVLASRLTINSNGNVGIGTITPSYLLDVNGSINGTSLYVNGTLLTASAVQLNYNNITTLGTFQASKTMTLNASGVGLMGSLGTMTTNCLQFYGGTAFKEIIGKFSRLR
jgi:hypothetical protein